MGRRKERERVAGGPDRAADEKPRSRRRRLLTAGIGAAAALAAGAVAISKAAIREVSERRAVVRLGPDGKGWTVTVAGRLEPSGHYQTKKAGLDAARTLARQLAPSELVIQRRDGSEQDRHRYSPSTADKEEKP